MKRWIKAGLCLLAGSLVILLGVRTSTGINPPLCTPPKVTAPPVRQYKCQGQPVSFSVTASGSAPLGYQWRKSGVNVSNGGSISGAMSNTLKFSLVTTIDAGDYDVVVTNGCGSVTSSPPATLTVNTASPPSITLKPTSQTTCAGQTVNFTLTASNASSYQWRTNGVNISNGLTGHGSTYSGVGLATLQISNVATADTVSASSGFDCVVRNACGLSVTSSPKVGLTVKAAPSVFSVTGRGSCCSGGTGVPVGLSGSQSGVNYQLRRNGSDTGSPVAGTGSAISFGLQTAAGTYTVVATSASTSCWVTMTGNATVTVNPKPTATVSGDTAICAGQSVTIRAALTGTGPWTVIWSDGFPQNNVIVSPATRVVSPSCTTNIRVSVVSDSKCTSSTTLGGAYIEVVNPATTPYTSNYHTNTISGVISNWAGDYIIGSCNFADVLVITNNGVLSDAGGFLGYVSSSSNNSALVTGTGSVWHNDDDGLIVGVRGAGNRMVIRNGGIVVNSRGYIGLDVTSASNSVLVTGTGSVWTNWWDLGVGANGIGNSLVISNGGRVVNDRGFIGLGVTSASNSVLVTGSGSVWSNWSDLYVGYEGIGNSLVITNGGSVVNNIGYIGFDVTTASNSVVVTGSGSVWSNQSDLYVGGIYGSGNSLVISNGGKVVNSSCWMGQKYGCNSNSVLVTGSGSVWSNRSDLNVGYSGGGNSLVITNGGTVVSSNLFVGFDPSSSNNFVTLDGGNLIVTNPDTGVGVLDVRRGTFIMNSGTAIVDQFMATNGVSSIVILNGGTLNSGGTSVTNAQTFAVGNPASEAGATFHLNGGIHSFNNGLRIRANAVLSGCGTINGAVNVDVGGTVLADCGGTLIFTGTITNNGTVYAVNGTTVDFLGPVVNNGLINGTGGKVQFFSTLENNGTVITNNVPDDSTGTDFWVLFFDVDPDWPVKLNLLISGSSATTGTVSIAGLGTDLPFSVTSGMVTTVDIPIEAWISNYDLVENKGIHVTADQRITVCGLMDEEYAADAFLGYPTSMLGTNYCVMARAPAYSPQFSIVATENNTTVTVTPSETTELEGHPGTDPFTVTLQQGQTYRLRTDVLDGWGYATNDVSGTFVASDKPIAVFAGAAAADVPAGKPWLNSLMEEQLPVASWGRQTLGVPLASRRYGDSYRVLAAYDNTEVTINGSVVTTLQKGQFYDTMINGWPEFRGSKPIQVAQFSNGESFDDKMGDPFYMLLPPTGRYMNNCTVSTPDLLFDSLYDPCPIHFLSLVVEQSAVSNTLVDGQPVPAASFKPIGTSGYYGAHVAVEDPYTYDYSSHTVSSSKPAGVQVYGFANYDGYGYIGGVTDVKLAAVPDYVSVPLNTPVTVDVLANDIFSSRSTVTLTIVSNPSYGTVVKNPDKTVTYTPALGYNTGDDQFTYQIAEQGNASAATVTMWVNNRPPVAPNYTTAMCGSNEVVIAVLANASDPDGDPLSILSVGSPGHTYGGVTNAHVEINPDNTVTYSTYDDEPASDSFTYMITDGRGGIATGTVDITINTGLANDDTQLSVCPGRPTKIWVLDNDRNSGIAAPLRIISYTSPSHGQAAIDSGSTNVIYTAGTGFFADWDTFTYTVTDGQCTNSAMVHAWVVNPVAPTNDTVQLLCPEQPITIRVLDNDAELYGGTLTVLSVNHGPDYGTVKINGDNTITYTPNSPTFEGWDQFNYIVTDGPWTNTATVYVEYVNPVQPGSDEAFTDGNTAVTIRVVDNDKDSCGRTLTVDSIPWGPYYGTVMIKGDNTITYTPGPDFIDYVLTYGPDVFGYTITDGQWNNSAQVTVSYESP